MPEYPVPYPFAAKLVTAGNAHRIYGPIRWPLLTAGWTIEDAEGPLGEVERMTGGSLVQPVYLLTPSARFINYERK